MIEIIKPKKEKTKKKKSIFLLTINTNKSLLSKSEEVRERAEEIKNKLIEFGENFRNPDVLRKLLLETNTNLPVPAKNIFEIEAKGSVEANTQIRGFLHMHMTISVIHDSKIKFNLLAIKNIVYKYFENVLTFQGTYYKPYVNIRGSHDNLYSMENYVMEEVASF